MAQFASTIRQHSFFERIARRLAVRLIGGRAKKLIDLQGDKFLFIERPRSSTEFNQAALDGWTVSPQICSEVM